MVVSIMATTIGADSKDIVGSIPFIMENKAGVLITDIAKQLVIVKLIFDIYKLGNGDVTASSYSMKNPIFDKLNRKKKLGKVHKLYSKNSNHSDCCFLFNL